MDISVGIFNLIVENGLIVMAFSVKLVNAGTTAWR